MRGKSRETRKTVLLEEKKLWYGLFDTSHKEWLEKEGEEAAGPLTPAQFARILGLKLNKAGEVIGELEDRGINTARIEKDSVVIFMRQGRDENGNVKVIALRLKKDSKGKWDYEEEPLSRGELRRLIKEDTESTTVTTGPRIPISTTATEEELKRLGSETGEIINRIPEHIFTKGIKAAIKKFVNLAKAKGYNIEGKYIENNEESAVYLAISTAVENVRPKLVVAKAVTPKGDVPSLGTRREDKWKKVQKDKREKEKREKRKRKQKEKRKRHSDQDALPASKIAQIITEAEHRKVIGDDGTPTTPVTPAIVAMAGLEPELALEEVTARETIPTRFERIRVLWSTIRRLRENPVMLTFTIVGISVLFTAVGWVFNCDVLTSIGLGGLTASPLAMAAQRKGIPFDELSDEDKKMFDNALTRVEQIERNPDYRKIESYRLGMDNLKSIQALAENAARTKPAFRALVTRVEQAQKDLTEKAITEVKKQIEYLAQNTDCGEGKGGEPYNRSQSDLENLYAIMLKSFESTLVGDELIPAIIEAQRELYARRMDFLESVKYDTESESYAEVLTKLSVIYGRTSHIAGLREIADRSRSIQSRLRLKQMQAAVKRRKRRKPEPEIVAEVKAVPYEQALIRLKIGTLRASEGKEIPQAMKDLGEIIPSMPEGSELRSKAKEALTHLRKRLRDLGEIGGEGPTAKGITKYLKWERVKDGFWGRYFRRATYENRIVPVIEFIIYRLPAIGLGLVIESFRQGDGFGGILSQGLNSWPVVICLAVSSLWFLWDHVSVRQAIMERLSSRGPPEFTIVPFEGRYSFELSEFDSARRKFSLTAKTPSGDIIGHLTVYEKKAKDGLELNGPTLHIEDIYIYKAYRNREIETTLLRTVAQNFLKLGLATIEEAPGAPRLISVAVPKDYPDAERLYKRLGFKLEYQQEFDLILSIDAALLAKPRSLWLTGLIPGILTVAPVIAAVVLGHIYGPAGLAASLAIFLAIDLFLHSGLNFGADVIFQLTGKWFTKGIISPVMTFGFDTGRGFTVGPTVKKTAIPEAPEVDADAVWPNTDIEKAISQADFGFGLSPATLLEKRALRKAVPLVKAIRRKEEELADRSGEDLEGELNSATELTDKLALLSEVSRRTTGMRPFDVQLLASIAQVDGNIIEFYTGEGKTLVTSLTAAIQALEVKAATNDAVEEKGGIHIVTSNDALAERDAGERAKFYAALGLKIAVCREGKTLKYNSETEVFEEVERKEAYTCDIVYGTAREFGFDYLRDILAPTPAERVNIKRRSAIIDEVDKILIDDAVTPLIISGPGKALPPDLYNAVDMLAKHFLEKGVDYTVDEKDQKISIEKSGLDKLEERIRDVTGNEDFTFDSEESAPVYGALIGLLENAIRANNLYDKDVHYKLQDGKVVLIDQATQRSTPDTHMSEGLHQALEAKHGLEINPESETLASISIQDLFSGYKRLSGATGTGLTESEEFRNIYKRNITRIPPNRASRRNDLGTLIYRNDDARQEAIINEVEEKHEEGTPVLVGTGSIAESNALAEELRTRGLTCTVLNANNEDDEATIIEEAGKVGAITIATAMAGRGTDIKLENKEKGLHVIGTNGESSRQGGQLRGRAARLGDPGSSVDMISLEDDLFSKFGGKEVVEKILTRRGADVFDFASLRWWSLRDMWDGYRIRRLIDNNRTSIGNRGLNQRSALVKFDKATRTFLEEMDKNRAKMQRGRQSDLDEEISLAIERAVNAQAGLLRDGNTVNDFFQWFRMSFGVKFSANDRVKLIGKLKKGTALREAEVEAVVEAAIEKAGKRIAWIRKSMPVSQIQGLLDHEILSARKDYTEAMSEQRKAVNVRSLGQLDPVREYENDAKRIFGNLEAGRSIKFLASMCMMKIAPAQASAIDEALASYVPAEEREEDIVQSLIMQLAPSGDPEKVAKELEGKSQDYAKRLPAEADKEPKAGILSGIGDRVDSARVTIGGREIKAGKLAVAAGFGFLQLGVPAITRAAQDVLPSADVAQETRLAAERAGAIQDIFNEYSENIDIYLNALQEGDYKGAIQNIDKSIALAEILSKVDRNFESRVTELKEKRETIKSLLEARTEEEAPVEKAPTEPLAVERVADEKNVPMEEEIDESDKEYREALGSFKIYFEKSYESRLQQTSPFATERNWWEKPRYSNPKFFELNPDISRRPLDKRLAIEGLRQIATPKRNPLGISHFLSIPGAIPMNIVPTGRIGDNIELDDRYYENAKKTLASMKDAKQTCFINYTGHQGPVGACLAQMDIPVYWQLVANERVLNALQDFAEYFQNNTFENDSNFAIVLEPKHAFIGVDILSLPSIYKLKNSNIKEIVVFSEDELGKTTNLRDFQKSGAEQEFADYLSELQKAGFPVKIVGLHTKSQAEKLMLDLSHKNPSIRMKAAEELGNIRAAEAEFDLIKAFEDKEWGVRLEAARALGKIKSMFAEYDLEELLKKEENKNVRAAAQKALEEIRKVKLDERVAQVLEELEAEGAEGRRASMKALIPELGIGVGKDRDLAMRILREAVTNEDSNLRSQALQVLIPEMEKGDSGISSTISSDVKSILEKAATSDSIYVRTQALQALTEDLKSGNNAWPILVTTLNYTRNIAVSASTAEALREGMEVPGIAGVRAALILEKALTSDDLEVRFEAVPVSEVTSTISRMIEVLALGLRYSDELPIDNSIRTRPAMEIAQAKLEKMSQSPYLEMRNATVETKNKVDEFIAETTKDLPPANLRLQEKMEAYERINEKIEAFAGEVDILAIPLLIERLGNANRDNQSREVAGRILANPTLISQGPGWITEKLFEAMEDTDMRGEIAGGLYDAIREVDLASREGIYDAAKKYKDDEDIFIRTTAENVLVTLDSKLEDAKRAREEAARLEEQAAAEETAAKEEAEKARLKIEKETRDLFRTAKKLLIDTGRKEKDIDRYARQLLENKDLTWETKLERVRNAIRTAEQKKAEKEAEKAPEKVPEAEPAEAEEKPEPEEAVEVKPAMDVPEGAPQTLDGYPLSKSVKVDIPTSAIFIQPMDGEGGPYGISSISPDTVHPDTVKKLREMGILIWPVPAPMQRRGYHFYVLFYPKDDGTFRIDYKDPMKRPDFRTFVFKTIEVKKAELSEAAKELMEKQEKLKEMRKKRDKLKEEVEGMEEKLERLYELREKRNQLKKEVEELEKYNREQSEGVDLRILSGILPFIGFLQVDGGEEKGETAKEKPGDVDAELAELEREIAELADRKAKAERQRWLYEEWKKKAVAAPGVLEAEPAEVEPTLIERIRAAKKRRREALGQAEEAATRRQLKKMRNELYGEGSEKATEVDTMPKNAVESAVVNEGPRLNKLNREIKSLEEAVKELGADFAHDPDVWIPQQLADPTKSLESRVSVVRAAVEAAQNKKETRDAQAAATRRQGHINDLELELQDICRELYGHEPNVRDRKIKEGSDMARRARNLEEGVFEKLEQAVLAEANRLSVRDSLRERLREILTDDDVPVGEVDQKVERVHNRATYNKEFQAYLKEKLKKVQEEELKAAEKQADEAPLEFLRTRIRLLHDELTQDYSDYYSAKETIKRDLALKDKDQAWLESYESFLSWDTEKLKEVKQLNSEIEEKLGSLRQYNLPDVKAVEDEWKALVDEWKEKWAKTRRVAEKQANYLDELEKHKEWLEKKIAFVGVEEPRLAPLLEETNELIKKLKAYLEEDEIKAKSEAANKTALDEAALKREIIALKESLVEKLLEGLTPHMSAKIDAMKTTFDSYKWKAGETAEQRAKKDEWFSKAIPRLEELNKAFQDRLQALYDEASKLIGKLEPFLEDAETERLSNILERDDVKTDGRKLRAAIISLKEKYIDALLKKLEPYLPAEVSAIKPEFDRNKRTSTETPAERAAKNKWLNETMPKLEEHEKEVDKLIAERAARAAGKPVPKPKPAVPPTKPGVPPAAPSAKPVPKAPAAKPPRRPARKPVQRAPVRRVRVQAHDIQDADLQVLLDALRAQGAKSLADYLATDEGREFLADRLNSRGRITPEGVRAHLDGWAKWARRTFLPSMGKPIHPYLAGPIGALPSNDQTNALDQDHLKRLALMMYFQGRQEFYQLQGMDERNARREAEKDIEEIKEFLKMNPAQQENYWQRVLSKKMQEATLNIGDLRKAFDFERGRLKPQDTVDLQKIFGFVRNILPNSLVGAWRVPITVVPGEEEDQEVAGDLEFVPGFGLNWLSGAALTRELAKMALMDDWESYTTAIGFARNHGLSDEQLLALEADLNDVAKILDTYFGNISQWSWQQLVNFPEGRGVGRQKQQEGRHQNRVPGRPPTKKRNYVWWQKEFNREVMLTQRRLHLKRLFRIFGPLLRLQEEKGIASERMRQRLTDTLQSMKDNQEFWAGRDPVFVLLKLLGEDMILEKNAAREVVGAKYKYSDELDALGKEKKQKIAVVTFNYEGNPNRVFEQETEDPERKFHMFTRPENDKPHAFIKEWNEEKQKWELKLEIRQFTVTDPTKPGETLTFEERTHYSGHDELGRYTHVEVKAVMELAIEGVKEKVEETIEKYDVIYRDGDFDSRPDGIRSREVPHGGQFGRNWYKEGDSEIDAKKKTIQNRIEKERAAAARGAFGGGPVDDTPMAIELITTYVPSEQTEVETPHLAETPPIEVPTAIQGVLNVAGDLLVGIFKPKGILAIPGTGSFISAAFISGVGFLAATPAQVLPQDAENGINYGGTSQYGQNFGTTAWYPAGNGISKHITDLIKHLDKMIELGIDHIRMGLVEDGRALLDRNGHVTGYNNVYRTDVKTLLDEARKKGRKIKFAILDFHMAMEGKDINGVWLRGRANVIKNPGLRQEFFNKFLIPFLDEFGKHETIAGFDLANELLDLWSTIEEDGKTYRIQVDEREVREFLTEMAKVIRKHQRDNGYTKPITVSINTENVMRQIDFLQELKGKGLIDYVAIHHYGHKVAISTLEQVVNELKKRGIPWALEEFATSDKDTNDIEFYHRFVRTHGGLGCYAWSFEDRGDGFSCDEAERDREWKALGNALAAAPAQPIPPAAAPPAQPKQPPQPIVAPKPPTPPAPVAAAPAVRPKEETGSEEEERDPNPVDGRPRTITVTINYSDGTQDKNVKTHIAYQDKGDVPEYRFEHRTVKKPDGTEEAVPQDLTKTGEPIWRVYKYGEGKVRIVDGVLEEAPNASTLIGEIKGKTPAEMINPMSETNQVRAPVPPDSYITKIGLWEDPDTGELYELKWDKDKKVVYMVLKSKADPTLPGRLVAQLREDNIDIADGVAGVRDQVMPMYYFGNIAIKGNVYHATQHAEFSPEVLTPEDEIGHVDEGTIFVYKTKDDEDAFMQVTGEEIEIEDPADPTKTKTIAAPDISTGRRRAIIIREQIMKLMAQEVINKGTPSEQTIYYDKHMPASLEVQAERAQEGDIFWRDEKEGEAVGKAEGVDITLEGELIGEAVGHLPRAARAPTAPRARVPGAPGRPEGARYAKRGDEDYAQENTDVPVVEVAVVRPDKTRVPVRIIANANIDDDKKVKVKKPDGTEQETTGVAAENVMYYLAQDDEFRYVQVGLYAPEVAWEIFGMLKDSATGSLKVFLDGLTVAKLEKEGIDSLAKLIKYLKGKATDNGYGEDEIPEFDKALSKSKKLGEVYRAPIDLDKKMSYYSISQNKE
ncbi:MAG: HEAT repeat domain-containing protein, partial [Omnitrophica bacterium]|nr:HEAT repeat domain-containing protein [Candidatus Omnitrophota bacterium]